MNKDDINSAIEATVKNIEIEYQRAQGIILTEDDLMSVIFHCWQFFCA